MAAFKKCHKMAALRRVFLLYASYGVVHGKCAMVEIATTAVCWNVENTGYDTRISKINHPRLKDLRVVKHVPKVRP
jgi:hypothetical protein